MNPLMDECRHDKLRTHEDYGYWKYEMAPKLIENGHLLQGIRTDRGLQLFSMGNTGYKAMSRCLTYYAMHLFDKQSGISYLESLMLYSLEGFVPTAGHRFLDKDDWEYTPADLPDKYFNDDIAAISLVDKKFDMAPTPANDLELRHNNGISELEIMSPVLDFTCLVPLHEGKEKIWKKNGMPVSLTSRASAIWWMILMIATTQKNEWPYPAKSGL